MEHLTFGCGCEETCNDEEICVCLAQHSCFYGNDGRLKLDEVNEPIYECNDCCSCPPSCINRVVQRAPPWKLKIKHTTNKGRGLFTDCQIPRGSFVIEYTGEILTSGEATTRLRNIRNTGQCCYLVVLHEHYGDIRRCFYVDAASMGNEARFINHSCQPNLQMIPVRTSTTHPHLALFASRDIQPGEELTFRYGNNSLEDHKTEHKEKRLKCFCGSSTCAGYLPFDCTVA